MSACTYNTQTADHTLNLITEAWKFMFPEILTLFTLGLVIKWLELEQALTSANTILLLRSPKSGLNILF